MRDLEITDGAAAGDWIESRLGSEVDTVAEQVPQVYEAYARVFHPAYDWGLKPVRWAKVAEAKGTTAHREMQWDALVGRSGWEGQIPLMGVMDFFDLDALCEILTCHTADPGDCYFGLCTIQGWLDSLPVGYLKPFLRLPDRDYIVLAGPLAAVGRISRDWSGAGLVRAVFVVPRAEALAQLAGRNEGSRREAPNLIWPEDRSWFVASEVDFDSTLVGGSAELIKAIVESPALEAWQVEPTDSLAFDADKINGARDAC
ncbi:MAG: hypothetical protein ACM30E_09965 [Nitrososphaerales archaeon]